jgi:hypothetical protein
MILLEMLCNEFCTVFKITFNLFCVLGLAADLSGRVVYGVGLWPLPYWDCGFESCLGLVCLSVEEVVLSGRDLCVELIALPKILPTVLCLAKCDGEASTIRRSCPARGGWSIKTLGYSREDRIRQV